MNGVEVVHVTATKVHRTALILIIHGVLIHLIGRPIEKTVHAVCLNCA